MEETPRAMPRQTRRTAQLRRAALYKGPSLSSGFRGNAGAVRPSVYTGSHVTVTSPALSLQRHSVLQKNQPLLQRHAQLGLLEQSAMREASVKLSQAAELPPDLMFRT